MNSIQEGLTDWRNLATNTMTNLGPQLVTAIFATKFNVSFQQPLTNLLLFSPTQSEGGGAGGIRL
jgi:hypothetical protein